MMWMLLVILTFTVWLTLYLYFNRKFDYWKLRGVPYIKPKFIFGNLLEFVLGNDPPGKYLAKYCQEFRSPYFGFYAFSKPYLVLRDPNIIIRILITDFNVFSDRYLPCDENIDPILSNGLFASKTALWKILRTKLSPFFSLRKIKLMLPLIAECNEHLYSHLKHKEGSCINAKEMATKYTTDIISSCAFGINANSFLDNDSGFREAGKTMLSDSFTRSVQILSYYYAPALVKLFKMKFIHVGATNFLRKTLLQTIEKREQSGKCRNDLIDILIQLKNEKFTEDGIEFNDDRLLAQAVTFFSAGYETSSSALSFTLHELALNAKIQDRLRNEINEVLEKNNGIVNYEAVQQMKYLHMVLSETLRKYTPTSYLHRECMQDYKVPETELIIEKGTPILVPQHGLHFNEKYFPNPEEYDPERFSDVNKHNIISGSYIPFGDGPRNCIGGMFGSMVTKMGLIEILRNFSVETNSQTQNPIVFSRYPLLKAKGGLPLTFNYLLH